MKKNIILIPLLIIICFSLLTLYTYNKSLFYKQLIWVILGFIILLVLNKCNKKAIIKKSYIFYYINLVLLVLVLFLGKEVNGSRAWFDFKFFSLQPSETMKLFMAAYLSLLFTSDIKYKYLKTFLVFLIPSILTFIEPDTGSVIMYFLIYSSLLFFTSKKKKGFYILFIIILILLIFGLYLYKYHLSLLINIFGKNIFYRIDRIISFKNNYQLNNALISMGSASLLFRSNRPLIYIPEGLTDFMFASVISIYGILSGFIIILCYLLMLLIILNKINFKKKNKAHMAFKFSFFILFLFQIIHNMFMNLGIVPIMGLPLPFLSYGGTNTIIYFLFLSLQD